MSKKLDEAYLEALDKITDLEAKLAEKDKTIENWQTMYQSVMKSCHNGIEEDKRLREQLAEQPKQIVNEIREHLKDRKVLCRAVRDDNCYIIATYYYPCTLVDTILRDIFLKECNNE